MSKSKKIKIERIEFNIYGESKDVPVGYSIDPVNHLFYFAFKKDGEWFSSIIGAPAFDTFINAFTKVK